MAEESASDVSRETARDEFDAAKLEAFFGPAYDKMLAFHGLLLEQGELRGLIGPRELDRLWERHLLNSAAVVQYLPSAGTIVDLGSGAGLPGIVIAAMVPGAEVILVEPMERRCRWLEEVREALALSNVEIKQGRAEEYHGAFEADALTARAVANLDRLGRWAFPLLRKGGQLVVLKGRQAQVEIDAATKMLRKYGVDDAEVLEARTLPESEPTTVVRATRRR